MPLMDYALIFSDEQDLSGAGSVASTNVIDFEETNPTWGTVLLSSSGSSSIRLSPPSRP